MRAICRPTERAGSPAAEADHYERGEYPMIGWLVHALSDIARHPAFAYSRRSSTAAVRLAKQRINLGARLGPRPV